MHFPRRILPQTITAQITAIVVGAVLLGIALTSGVLLCLLYNWRGSTSPELIAETSAARIATVVKAAEASRSPNELAKLLVSARRPGLAVELVPIAQLSRFRSQSIFDPETRAIVDILYKTWGISPISGVTFSRRPRSIAMETNDNKVLIFDLNARSKVRAFVLVPTAFGLGVTIFITIFLSIYAVRWVTSPLLSIAEAARSFGRSQAADQILDEHGPREIAEVSRALNDMRRRVRALVDERTRMLTAISHDLRTPLTRLRLRSERVADDSARRSMLSDITMITDMIGETIGYLREDGRSEVIHPVDLPSLLQTICAEFSDVGHNVSYTGAARFALNYRAKALTRAVVNIVDNGTKHGSSVVVSLQAFGTTGAQVDISDDGPGIPLELRQRVFEPFFKGATARPSSGRGGFGLGLSIARDIVECDGGKISLLDHHPKGLTVRLLLSTQSDTGMCASAPEMAVKS